MKILITKYYSVIRNIRKPTPIHIIWMLFERDMVDWKTLSHIVIKMV